MIQIYKQIIYNKFRRDKNFKNVLIAADGSLPATANDAVITNDAAIADATIINDDGAATNVWSTRHGSNANGYGNALTTSHHSNCNH